MTYSNIKENCCRPRFPEFPLGGGTAPDVNNWVNCLLVYQGDYPETSL